MIQTAANHALAYGRQFLSQGKVATYIPALGKGDPDQLGLAVYTKDGRHYEYGDVTQRFAIQSISKAISLSVALQHFKFSKVFSDVMMEPSGDAFNSILKLDTASDRPFNPFINAGAIQVVGTLAPTFRFDEMLAFTRRLCLDPDITLNEEVYLSEAETGDRNRAIGYLLKSKGVLRGDVQETVDLYFRLCSLNVTARSLAGFALVLACGGVDPHTGERLLDDSACRVVKMLMLTCGLYDGSGEFAVSAGMPAKSGVGGGIAACVEDNMGIGTFGPALDAKGNSIGGIKMLEYLSRELHLHIFDSHSSGSRFIVPPFTDDKA